MSEPKKKKPTIEELEKIMEDPESGAINIAPDGSLSVGPRKGPPTQEELLIENRTLRQEVNQLRHKLRSIYDQAEKIAEIAKEGGPLDIVRRRRP